jgi:hypothetical protein
MLGDVSKKSGEKLSPSDIKAHTRSLSFSDFSVTWRTLHPSPGRLLWVAALCAQPLKAEGCCSLGMDSGNDEYLLLHDSKTRKNFAKLYLGK